MGAGVGRGVPASSARFPSITSLQVPALPQLLLNSALYQQWTTSNFSNIPEVPAARGLALQKINSGNTYFTVQSR